MSGGFRFGMRIPFGLYEIEFGSEYTGYGYRKRLVANPNTANSILPFDCTLWRVRLLDANCNRSIPVWPVHWST